MKNARTIKVRSCKRARVAATRLGGRQAVVRLQLPERLLAEETGGHKWETRSSEMYGEKEGERERRRGISLILQHAHGAPESKLRNQKH